MRAITHGAGFLGRFSSELGPEGAEPRARSWGWRTGRLSTKMPACRAWIHHAPGGAPLDLAAVRKAACSDDGGDPAFTDTGGSLEIDGCDYSVTTRLGAEPPR